MMTTSGPRGPLSPNTGSGLQSTLVKWDGYVWAGVVLGWNGDVASLRSNIPVRRKRRRARVLLGNVLKLKC